MENFLVSLYRFAVLAVRSKQEIERAAGMLPLAPRGRQTDHPATKGLSRAVYGLATRRKDCWAPPMGTCTVVTLPVVTGVCCTGVQKALELRLVVDCNWRRAAEPGQE